MDMSFLQINIGSVYKCQWGSSKKIDDVVILASGSEIEMCALQRQIADLHSEMRGLRTIIDCLVAGQRSDSPGPEEAATDETNEMPDDPFSEDDVRRIYADANNAGHFACILTKRMFCLAQQIYGSITIGTAMVPGKRRNWIQQERPSSTGSWPFFIQP